MSLEDWIAKGTCHFAGNVETKMEEVNLGDLTLPITINDAEYDNCFVVSPYGQYVLYGLDEVERKGGWQKPVIKALIAPLSKALRMGKINRVVAVNNWLMNTTLHPKMPSKNLFSLTSDLINRFPEHALLFRSLTPAYDEELCNSLKNLGFKLIPSRIVYLLDTKQPGLFNARMFKSDLKLLKETDYEIVPHEEIPFDQAGRIQELYEMLYIEKYSRQNVQWKRSFFEWVLKSKSLTLIGLMKNGRLDGIVGYYVSDKIMTAPLFGYDTSLSQENGLYRMLSLLVVQEAHAQDCLLNESSGAGSFKMLRRAKPVMEYSAVYTRHLPIMQKLVWGGFAAVLKTVGEPIMKRVEG